MGREEKPLLALIVPSLEEGGGVPAVARFVRDTALRSNKYRLKFVSLAISASDPLNLSITRPSSWFRGPTVAQGEWEGYPFIRVGARFGELEFQRLRPRRALSRELESCDLIQVVCGSPAWANAVIGLGKPVALQVATRARVERRMRNARPSGIAGWWRKAMTEVTDRLDDLALRRVDAIQLENPWMLEYSRQLNRHRKVDIHYAPPGIDATRFKPGPERLLDARRYILCVGRLDDPRKNVGLLLQSFAMLPVGVRANCRLLLAGSGAPPRQFWLRVKELGLQDAVEYIARPSQNELVRLYQSASLFALPSDEEGLGVVILEAMACAVPVVATRCGGPEGIITDGKDGFLVDRNDVVAFVDRMQALLQNPAMSQSVGRHARATIEARYSEQVAGQAFLDIWERLLRTPSKP